ncbi:MAG: RNA 2',3'-cyclic phosphodiesterase [Burkholderiales bacterium]|nr:RNA 2',3'-cyclic phosphodiesterase [Burkholderiales bacterium]
MRLFFALWPEEPVRRQLAELSLKVRQSCGGRATPFDNLHLTLVFLGQVAEEEIGKVRGAAEEVQLPGFELRLTDLGFWPAKGIAWIAPGNPPRTLFDLAGELASRLAARGFRLETRPYVPHLTLLRRARCDGVSLPAVDIAWPVRQFVLVASTLSSHGASYERLGVWPLAAKAGVD